MSATPPRSRRPGPRPPAIWGVVTALLVMVTIGMGGCGPAREGETLELVVPAGTGDRLAMGETVTIMPSELTFRVGDTIRIRNDDRFPQSVGPYLVAAGEVFELQYGSPGTYEGYCPLSQGETYRIVVTP